MSSTIVSTCRIDKINPHSNADRLELAVVGGWQCVVLKGQYKAGDLITYIPPDSILPNELIDKLGVANHLSGNRTKPVRLRGEISFGLVIDPVGKEGENVAEKLGITKLAPVLNLTEADAEINDPLFTKYTDIENLRNFVGILEDGEEVVVLEKIHGKNTRLGMVKNENGEWVRRTGGRSLQRKQVQGSAYWECWSAVGVEDLRVYLCSLPDVTQVVICGEAYGRTQKMKYGIPGKVGFRVFDIILNGRYLDWDETEALLTKFNVECAPILFRGKYSLEKIKELSKGRSLVPGADHIREGVVVHPVKERRNEKVGRVIFKYVSDEFLLGDYDDAGE